MGALENRSPKHATPEQLRRDEVLERMRLEREDFDELVGTAVVGGRLERQWWRRFGTELFRLSLTSDLGPAA